MDTEPGRKELDAALSGNAVALRSLCGSLYPTVQHAVAAMLRYRSGSPSALVAERDDLVQEVFRYLLDKDARPLRLWDPERSGGRTLKSWVGLIAGRHAARVSARRAAQRTGEPTDFELFEHDEHDELGATIVRRDLVDKLLVALRRELSESEMALFEAIFVEARPASEVAAQWGVAPNTLHKRCQRLRSRVAQIAEQLVQGGHPAVATLVLLLIASVHVSGSLAHATMRL